MLSLLGDGDLSLHVLALFEHVLLVVHSEFHGCSLLDVRDLATVEVGLSVDGVDVAHYEGSYGLLVVVGQRRREVVGRGLAHDVETLAGLGVWPVDGTVANLPLSADAVRMLLHS